MFNKIDKLEDIINTFIITNKYLQQKEILAKDTIENVIDEIVELI